MSNSDFYIAQKTIETDMHANPKLIEKIRREHEASSGNADKHILQQQSPLSIASTWPEPPAPEAFYGLAGDVVRTIEPHTEASAVALLVQTLLCFGNLVGRTAHFVAEGSQHFTNLFAVLVGISAYGRKGSSWAQIFRLFRMVSPEWADQKITSGLSSGEGLIWAVRDPTCKNGEIVDPGIIDKRTLILESEFVSPLRMMARDGNILSVVIREAWDTGKLRVITKNSPATATGAHISIVGHITRDELRRELSATDMGNGFANRILWVCTARSKELPEGGSLTNEMLIPCVNRLKEAVEFARNIGEMKRDPAIKEMWRQTYHELTSGKPGLLGAVTARAEAQTMRLACLYSLLDQAATVRAEHLLAAVALWEYCQASARYIFGDSLGDHTADTILQTLRVTPEGLDRTAISEIFNRHKSTEEITRALGVLVTHGLANPETDSDASGRPREVWKAVVGTAKKAN